MQNIDTLASVGTATHCPYCALQCGMRLSGSPQHIVVNGNEEFPVNKGGLCVKGWNSAATLTHPERLLSPLLRDAGGELRPAPWDEALSYITRSIVRLQEAYGRDAIGLFGGGALTNEKAYLLGKFARVALGTAHIDYNGRFCMSSAASAATTAFGIDRGLPFPLEDIPRAQVIMLVGSNVAETMPPVMQYFEAQRDNGGKLIVVDPRASATARAASMHLRLTPGTDAALANGLLHILLRDGLLDLPYIERRTEGFEQIKALVATYWPEYVERVTGVPVAQLVEAARLLGSAQHAMILTARGAEQQWQGVNNVLAFINIALALGLVGRPFSGYGCLTGQGNGQGGREHGQKADQLPGYRKINDPESRRHIANVWQIAEHELPQAGKSAYEMLDAIGQPDGIRGLLVMGSNIAVSAPHSLHIQERLRALDLLVVADFFLSETAQMADVVLPVTQWAEEDGTMTNLEGRVLHRVRAVAPPAGVRSDTEILCDLAQRLGRGQYFHFTEQRQIFEELCRASAGGIADYSGITYEKIVANQGVFWPCPTAEHPGTERLFQDTFPLPRGRARFRVVRHQRSAEEPDSDYPLYLTTGRVLAQYQSGTQTRRIASLRKMAPVPFVELHPTTARFYDLAHGELVTLITRRGAARFNVKITSTIREDTVFVPFHWGGEQSINRLTNAALDPISGMPEFKVCAVRLERVATSAEV